MMMEGTSDIRHEIFRGYLEARIRAVLTVEKNGVLSGLNRATAAMTSLGLQLITQLRDGGPVKEGQEIAGIVGNPVQVALAEERIIGTLSKSSGIATAAFHAREKIHPRCRVVSGGWKKMPLEIKDQIRQAALDGGIDVRMWPKPFVYLDKNYVRVLGSVKNAIEAVLHFDRTVVIQVRGETGPIGREAVVAAETGAGVVMVDTGRLEDAVTVLRTLQKKKLRQQVNVAFAGDIALAQLETISRMGVDIVDIGYAILDAPCLPMRFDVIDVER